MRIAAALPSIVRVSETAEHKTAARRGGGRRAVAARRGGAEGGGAGRVHHALHRLQGGAAARAARRQLSLLLAARRDRRRRGGRLSIWDGRMGDGDGRSAGVQRRSGRQLQHTSIADRRLRRVRRRMGFGGMAEARRHRRQFMPQSVQIGRGRRRSGFRHPGVVHDIFQRAALVRVERQAFADQILTG